MPLTPDSYEKLGAFYLGREYDVEKKLILDDLVLYDSKDLVTHGVVLGMTGSGKTGLCLTLLEEAAIDGIPIIAVDPKGDIGNALLTFPALTGADFEPWVNPDDARRKGVSVPEFAESQAKLWQTGLSDWGQSGSRIDKLRQTVEMSIYTPGSTAGLPVSILSSLDCPAREVIEDSEAFGDRIESTASSLLSLLGIDADPVQSPDHILLSNILSHFWKQQQNVSLEHLVRHIQQPPIRKIGVMDVESFMPEAKRSALAMKLNNLIASPNFSAWLAGEPLDIQRMFYTEEGKPRLSIFSISHLSDAERMFFVSLLLNQLVGWMRSQQGTSSLRALFFMDEIYGYLPPSAMPPSKKPMMILLKQARAFGLGMLLATQNPVDLDYKALSNIGTWWLGRLQTERDKARLLDGLEGAASSGAFNRREIEALLSGLGNRVFLMNNVHEEAPVVFHVRWLMSYLSGPLARDQIKRLMGPRKKATAALPTSDEGFRALGASSPPPNTAKPALPEGVAEAFLPTDLPGSLICYVPAILRSARVEFDDARRQINGSSVITFVNPIDLPNQRVLWDQPLPLAAELEVTDLPQQPKQEAAFADIPSAGLKSSTYTGIKKDFIDWVYGNHSIEVSYSPLLDAVAQPGEKPNQFMARLTQQAREKRDEALTEVRRKHEKTLKSLTDKIARASLKVETQKTQASGAKIATAVHIGSSLLSAMFGRRKGVGTMLRSSTVGSATRVIRESQEAAAAEADLLRLQEELRDLENRLAQDLQTIQEQHDPSALTLQNIKLKPLKKNIHITAVGILWLPHEHVGGALRPAWT